MEPTKIYKVCLRYVSVAGKATVTPNVLEYDVVKVTEKSYMIRSSRAEYAHHDPYTLPKDKLGGEIVGDGGSPSYKTMYAWAYGNTGQVVDELKMKLLEDLKLYRTWTQQGIDLLEQEL